MDTEYIESTKSDHVQYHEQTIELLRTNADILSDIAILTNGMLGILIIATLLCIWKLR